MERHFPHLLVVTAGWKELLLQGTMRTLADQDHQENTLTGADEASDQTQDTVKEGAQETTQPHSACAPLRPLPSAAVHEYCNSPLTLLVHWRELGRDVNAAWF